VAGVVLLWLAPEYVIMLSAACSLPMLAIVIWLRRREARHAVEEAQTRLSGAPSNIWQDMKAGFLYVLRDARIAPVVCLLMAMSFFLRPISDMLPPFVARIPGGGASELAMLVSAFGVGALTAGLSITILRRNSRLENWLVAAMLACSAATLGFVYSESLALSIALAAVAGGGQSVTGIAAKTIMQTVCAPAFRGRVMAAYSTFHLGGPAIGLPFVGMLAELIELRLAFVITVLISLCITVTVVMKKLLGR
jgi:sugar phosphate permease